MDRLELFFKNIKRLGMSAIQNLLGPFVAPLAPALIIASTFYLSSTLDVYPPVKLAIAACIVIGLVSAGLMASNAAIAYGDRRAWYGVFGYVLIEIVAMLFLETSTELKVIGIGVSGLILIVYYSTSTVYKIEKEEREAAARAQAEKDEAKAEQNRKIDYTIEKDRSNTAHTQEMERLKLEAKLQRDLAKIEAGTVAKVSQPSGASVAKVSGVNDQVSGEQNVSDPLQNALLEAYKADHKVNLTQLAQEIGSSRHTLTRRRNGLVSAGLLHKNGAGYKVTN